MSSAVNDALAQGENITPAHLRLTSRFLTKYEFAAAVAMRARDIASGQFVYGRVLADNSAESAATKKKVAGKGEKKRRTDSSAEDDDDDDDDDDSKQRESAARVSGGGFADTSPMAAIVDQDRVSALPLVFSDPVMIAKHELVQKRLPFVVKRCIGADLPSVNANAGDHKKYRVEVIPIRDLEVDVRSIDLGEWIY